MPLARASTSSGFSGRTAGEYVTASAPATFSGLWPTATVMPWERSRSATGESFRSEPETWWPMAAQHEGDGAHAGPADAHDVDCAGGDRRGRRAGRRGSAVSAGMGIDQFGDAGGRVGVSVVPGRLAHGAQALGIGQQRIELEGEPPPVAVADRGCAPPRPWPTSASALRVWWSRGAPGSGTRMAGTPATSSSATVMAPARTTHTSAAL